MALDVTAIQQALNREQLDGWLLYDFHGSNPIASRLLGTANGTKMTTRRWFYLVPAHGEPRGLVHAIERKTLDALPGEKTVYAGRQQFDAGLTKLLTGVKRVAMEYSRDCAIPYISRIDAGTVELVRAAGPERGLYGAKITGGGSGGTVAVLARRDAEAAVRAIAARYRGLNVPFDDLMQEGCIGLLEAIETFDSSRGVDFETYSRFQVRCAIRNALTQTSRLVRLPKRVVERRRTIDRTEARLAAAGGHAPSPVEIAGALGLPLDVIVETRATPVGWTSLEPPLDQVLSDVSAVDPARDAAARDDVSQVAAAVNTLPERQREVVVRRFGLGCPAEDLGDVAASLHVSRQRARAIEQAALCALRDRLDPPGATEGEEPCIGTSSSPTARSTGRHERSQRRSRRPSGRAAPTHTPSLR